MQDRGSREQITSAVVAGLATLVPLIAVAGVLGLPQRLGLMVFPQQLAALMLCTSLAVCFLRCSLSSAARFWQLDLGLALASLALGVHVFIPHFPSKALISLS